MGQLKVDIYPLWCLIRGVVFYNDLAQFQSDTKERSKRRSSVESGKSSSASPSPNSSAWGQPRPRRPLPAFPCPSRAWRRWWPEAAGAWLLEWAGVPSSDVPEPWEGWEEDPPPCEDESCRRSGQARPALALRSSTATAPSSATSARRASATATTWSLTGSRTSSNSSSSLRPSAVVAAPPTRVRVRLGETRRPSVTAVARRVDLRPRADQ